MRGRRRAHGDPRRRGGERVVGMREFHRGPYETAVGPGEMLVEIRVPLRAGSGSAYEKVDRRVGDWAVVAAGAALELDGRDDRARRRRARRRRRGHHVARGRGGARGRARRPTRCSPAAAALAAGRARR